LTTADYSVAYMDVLYEFVKHTETHCSIAVTERSRVSVSLRLKLQQRTRNYLDRLNAAE